MNLLPREAHGKMIPRAVPLIQSLDRWAIAREVLSFIGFIV